MESFLQSIFEEVILSVLVTIIPMGILWLSRNRKHRLRRRMISDIERRLSMVEFESDTTPNEIEKDLQSIDRGIDRYRRQAELQLQKGRLSKEAFLDINDAINTQIGMIRIRFLQYLFRDVHEIQEILNIMFVDRQISQKELYALFNEIRQLKTVTKEKQETFIDFIHRHLITNNKVLSSDKYLTETLANTPLLRKLPLFELGIGSIVLFLLSGVWIFRYQLSVVPAHFVFGAVDYVGGKDFIEYTDALAGYLTEKSGKTIDIRVYDFEHVEDLWNDVVTNTVQGVIINPGTYVTFFRENKHLDDHLEIFCQHEQDTNVAYRSILITRTDQWERFLRRIGLRNVPFDPEYPTPEWKKVMRDYILQGTFSYTHRNSLSGYSIPFAYLWSEFGIDPRQDARVTGKLQCRFSGNHGNSIDGVFSGEYNCASVYDGLLTSRYRDQMDEITILYSSPSIPYNSYWYRKDLDGNLKNQIRSLLLSLKYDMSDEAMSVKGNKIDITGWIESDVSKYYRQIVSSFEILGARLPKPYLRFRISSARTAVHDFLIELTTRSG